MSASGSRRSQKPKPPSQPAERDRASVSDEEPETLEPAAEIDAAATEAEPTPIAESSGADLVPSAEGDAAEAGEPAPPLTISQIAPASGEAELNRARLKQALEALIFVSERVVTAVQLGRALKAKVVLVRELIAELMQDYQGRGIELCELAGGYQFRSAPACAPFVREYVAQKPVRLTRAQLETLALVCYRQPITRPEVDDIRGVDSGSAMRVLLERNLIKMLGRKDEPGRPLLYGTTPHFLAFFGMRSLKDLPTLREFTELSDENRALFKRKTGEDVGAAEAALAEAEEAARADGEAEAHISDEDLAQLAAEADAQDEIDAAEEHAIASHAVPGATGEGAALDPDEGLDDPEELESQGADGTGA